MTHSHVEIAAFAQEMDILLQQQCAARGFDYKAVRQTLKLDWTIAGMEAAAAVAKNANAPFLAILQRALACEKAGDKPGRDAACLEWLHAKHGVRIGDTVQLVGGYMAKPRTVKLEGCSIDLNEEDLLHSFASFTGPCISHTVRNSNPTLHSQYLDDILHKIPA